MGKALYRKYRSKQLSEVIGQEHITTALSNALKDGKISHAYLFTGPRGVGKTSVARILAHELNGLPYDEDATILDIIEIDAASNRRIDEIRELRDRINNAPAAAKYKVYIIDEVHMLTREAFNALLKTLEEPPEHAVFILATTEAHRLPETIVSRTQRFTFRPIEPAKVIAHLRDIAKQEKIDITDEALELIARHGEGSFRDSISLLDQVRHSDQTVTLPIVQRSLGMASDEALASLLRALTAADGGTVLENIQAMLQQGYHAPQIARQLSEKLRSSLLNGKPTLPVNILTRLLTQLLEVPASHDPARYLEIIVLEAALAAKPSEAVQPEQKLTEAPEQKTTPKEKLPAERASAKPAKKTIKPKPAQPAASKPTETAQLDDKGWQTVLQAIKATHNTLYSVARMAVPTFSPGSVTLTFSFPFHQKRLNDPRNKQIISDIILQTTGQQPVITCEVDVNVRKVPAAITQPTEPDPALQNINNIFGGGEVLE